ncbi:MAG TPA: GNAT family N-acetyltransferase [Propionibacteriaceae bacterium]|nr:GNAT family N-acetyltransferase [Propionibacteriaceae bacterium]
MPAPTVLAAWGVTAPRGYRLRRVGWLERAVQQLLTDPALAASADVSFLDVVDVVLAERHGTDDGWQPVGCGVLVERAGLTETKLVYVAAADRRRGVGSSILQALERLAVIHGGGRLLAVTPGEPGATALYAHAGWEPIASESGDGAGRCCFARELPGPDSASSRIRSRRAARALVLDHDQNVLMTENLLNGQIHWGLPGGGIDGDESAVEAAQRELAEETGLTGVPLDGPVARREYFDDFPDVVLHQREEIFWGRSASTDVTVDAVLEDEAYLVGLRWWSPAELAANPDQVHPSRLLELLSVLLEVGTPPEPLCLTSAADSLHLV